LSDKARRTAYYLALAGMELSLWGLANQILTVASGHAIVSLAGIAGILMLSLATNLALLRAATQAAPRWSTGVGIVCALFFAAWSIHGNSGPLAAPLRTLRDLLAVGLGDFRPALFAFGIGLAIWWRGSALIRIPRAYRNVAFHFRLGVLILLLLLMMRATVSTVNPQAYIVSFFASSLLALALARAEETLTVAGGTPLALDWRWAIWLVTATAATVTFGLLAAKAFSFSTLRALFIWMSPVLSPVALAVYTAMLWFARLFDPVIRALVAFIQGAYQGQPPVPSAPPALAEQGPPPTPIQWPIWLPSVLAALRWMAVVLIALLVVWLLVQVLTQHQDTETDTPGGQKETLQHTRTADDSGGIGQIMKRAADALINVRHQWRKPRSPAEQVKWFYVRLLQLGAERGAPRPPGVTPYGHQSTLIGQFSGCDNEVRTMTEAYVQARYAEAEIDEETVHEVHKAWKKIQTIGH